MTAWRTRRLRAQASPGTRPDRNGSRDGFLAWWGEVDACLRARGEADSLFTEALWLYHQSARPPPQEAAGRIIGERARSRVPRG